MNPQLNQENIVSFYKTNNYLSRQFVSFETSSLYLKCNSAMLNLEKYLDLEIFILLYNNFVQKII